MRRFATAWIAAGLLALAVVRADAQGTGNAPVIAPSKPVVAPGIAPRGDSGATPGAARSANARTLSVSARQAAEQTIAALVAAMKNMPKRPPAPPEPRTARERREAGSRGQALDAPTPINYHVTWPVSEPEPGLGRRVELDWPGRASTGSVSLRWNDPTPQ